VKGLGEGRGSNFTGDGDSNGGGHGIKSHSINTWEGEQWIEDIPPALKGAFVGG